MHIMKQLTVMPMFQVKMHNSIPPDANMKDAIYNYGPIWVAVDASSNAWTNYTGGIFTETSVQVKQIMLLCLLDGVIVQQFLAEGTGF